MMTKSDYELLANAFYDQRLVELTVESHESVETINRLARRLAKMLGNENPRFNQTQFLNACGLPPKEH